MSFEPPTVIAQSQQTPELAVSSTVDEKPLTGYELNRVSMEAQSSVSFTRTTAPAPETAPSRQTSRHLFRSNIAS
jgi:hypothetical protein